MTQYYYHIILLYRCPCLQEGENGWGAGGRSKSHLKVKGDVFGRRHVSAGVVIGLRLQRLQRKGGRREHIAGHYYITVIGAKTQTGARTYSILRIHHDNNRTTLVNKQNTTACSPTRHAVPALVSEQLRGRNYYSLLCLPCGTLLACTSHAAGASHPLSGITNRVCSSLCCTCQGRARQIPRLRSRRLDGRELPNSRIALFSRIGTVSTTPTRPPKTKKTLLYSIKNDTSDL